ncbi:MAG: MoxR-like ATPase [Candidatus Woesearchaeota archaeon]|nr:MoxR-like ATPase [Candidatus Woesearchaeota archaeon]
MNSELNERENPPFIFKDNSQARNLKELIEKLENSDADLFQYHVNSERNDFANWIQFGLGLPELAKIVRGISNKESLVEAIKLYLTTSENQKLKQQEKQKNEANNQELEPEKKNKILSLFKEKDNSSVNNEINNQNNKTDDDVELPWKKGDSTLSNNISNKFQNSTNKPETSSQPYESSNKPQMPIQIKTTDTSKYRDTSSESENRLTDEEAQKIGQMLNLVKEEIKKVIFGQDEVIEYTLIALLCEGDALLEGVPGLAKSLLVETLARVISGTSFNRIQFMPDLLPSDIIGGLIYDPSTNKFTTFKGPIFANFILADEINRAPPKTHAALMEAMQEKKINIHDETYILDRPFFVLATQNPLENKGTYNLPEAILDRFLFKIILDYPDRESEKRVINENSIIGKVVEKKVLPRVTKEDVLELQSKVKNVFISDRIKEYILDIVEATRGKNKSIEGMQFIKYGAGPRASIYLGIASKARALMQGRNFVLPEDVAAVAKPILRHRLILNFKGKAHNISTDKIIDEILIKVKPE